MPLPPKARPGGLALSAGYRLGCQPATSPCCAILSQQLGPSKTSPLGTLQVSHCKAEDLHMQPSHGKPAELETSREAGSLKHLWLGEGGRGLLEAMTTSCLPQATQPEHSTLSTRCHRQVWAHLWTVEQQPLSILALV